MVWKGVQWSGENRRVERIGDEKSGEEWRVEETSGDEWRRVETSGDEWRRVETSGENKR